MFSFIKNSLSKIYHQVSGKLHALFARPAIDEQTLKELELLLLSADTGVKTTRSIIQKLQADFAAGKITQGSVLQQALIEQLNVLLKPASDTLYQAPIFLLVGINGSGKTTFAGKFTHQLVGSGKKVLLVAADTFRAAASQQLAQWAAVNGSDIVMGKDKQDPSAVVFQGCQQFKDGDYDALVIDTAGRLQTKAHLMKELEKIKKTIAKQLPEKQIITLLTIDAMLGQNSFEQAKLFHESTQLDGIVLTKMDGTGKGGIVFSISGELQVPVAFISYGEQLSQLKKFNPEEYINDLVRS